VKPYKQEIEEIMAREKDLITYSDSSPLDISVLPGMTKEDMEDLTLEELRELRLKHLPYLSRLIKKRNPHMKDPKPGEVTSYCWDHQFLIMRPCQAEEDGTVTLFDFEGNPLPMPEPKVTIHYPKINPDGSDGPAEGDFSARSMPFQFTETSSVRLNEDGAEDIDSEEEWEEVEFDPDQEVFVDPSSAGEKHNFFSADLDLGGDQATIKESFWSKRGDGAVDEVQMAESFQSVGKDDTKDGHSHASDSTEDGSDSSAHLETDSKASPQRRSPPVDFGGEFPEDPTASSTLEFNEEALAKGGLRLLRRTDADESEKPRVAVLRDQFRIKGGRGGSDTTADRTMIEQRSEAEESPNDDDESLLDFVRRTEPQLEALLFQKEDKAKESRIAANLRGDRAFEDLKLKYKRSKSKRSTTGKGARIQL